MNKIKVLALCFMAVLLLFSCMIDEEQLDYVDQINEAISNFNALQNGILKGSLVFVSTNLTNGKIEYKYASIIDLQFVNKEGTLNYYKETTDGDGRKNLEKRVEGLIHHYRDGAWEPDLSQREWMLEVHSEKELKKLVPGELNEFFTEIDKNSIRANKLRISKEEEGDYTVSTLIWPEEVIKKANKKAQQADHQFVNFHKEYLIDVHGMLIKVHLYSHTQKLGPDGDAVLDQIQDYKMVLVESDVSGIEII